jgi:predicted alpha-1,2-mannosidase
LRAGAQSLPGGEGPLQPDLFIGTGGHGHTYPGATLPFGMVQLSPDTDNARWDACSGYHRDDTSIMGFSHTHLSGTGIGDMLDVLVVPTRGKLELEPGPLDNPDAGYRQRFSGEHAEAGYYRVQLESGVLAELTATERAGVHRYTFPQGKGHILIDFAHCKQEAPGEPVIIDEASLDWGDDNTLTGSRRVFRWAKGRRIHFALQLSRKPDRVAFYGDDNKPAGSQKVSGRRLKVALFFDDAGAQPILIRTGISGVDVAGAQANLAADVHGWDFDHYRRAAVARWHRHMDTLRVEGGTPDQRKIMASAIYHSLLAPTQFTDCDGRYMGMDGQIHTAPADQPAFSSYSLWDTYRALHPLITLIQPEKARQFTQDLIRQATQSRYGPSVWPLQGVETGCMIGWHAVVVMAEAITKGIPGTMPPPGPPSASVPSIPKHRIRTTAWAATITMTAAGSRRTRSLNRSAARWNMPMTTTPWRSSPMPWARMRMPPPCASGRSTMPICSMPGVVSCARVWTMAGLPSPMTPSIWAIPRNGAISPRATAGRRPSSTSTTSTG